MLHTVHVVQAFAEGQIGGARMAVVAGADHLEASARQRIAQVMGLPTTTFVSRGQTDLWELQSYSAAGEAFAQSNNAVAALALLPQLGAADLGWHRAQAESGVSDLLLESDGAFLKLPPAKYAHVLRDSVTLLQVQHALDLPADHWKRVPLPCRAECGSAYLLVAVPDQVSLLDVVVEPEILQSLCQRLNLAGCCVFALPTRGGDTIASRVFAADSEQSEQGASEIAAGALACYVHDHLGQRTDQLQVDQGEPCCGESRLRLRAILERHDDGIVAVRVGGEVRIWRSFQFEA
ncbi:hypothetical protein C7S18_01830 [Ahniella affigens]|uniref:PhzF family phenazine biosynthesis protein n=1 Tax=Ahniella affigens TaxID=2021234 RepID=A0A2P1PMF4_9GAMM|nr:PhzF family phenazine biosynthesis protein [Ahniella affigens]AVP96007.1 hypothetical protein C7S18_01830 [Ahniella affigens]